MNGKVGKITVKKQRQYNKKKGERGCGFVNRGNPKSAAGALSWVLYFTLVSGGQQIYAIVLCRRAHLS